MKLVIAPMAVALAAALSVGFAHAQATGPTAAASLPDTFTPERSAQGPVATAVRSQPEASLRGVIASIQGNNIDYTVFSEDLGEQVRAQADNIGNLLSQFGAIQSVTNRGDQDGAELFEVQFENQKTEWLIALDDNNRIAVLLFRPA